MSARNYAFSIGAGAQVRLPAGRYFFVRTASAAINVTTEGNPGSPLSFKGISGGTKFGPVDQGQGWTYLIIQSASAQNLEIVISDDGLFDVANTVTVSGAVTTTDQPSTAIATPAGIAVASGTAQTIAANLARRRITICNPSTATGSVFAQAVGAGAGRGIEIQPGTAVEFRTTAAIDVRNDSGALVTVTTFEET